MPTSDRRRYHGERLTRAMLHRLGEDLRAARLASGISQRSLGSALGSSGSQIGRLERAELPEASLHQLVLAFAMLGQRLSARAYPEGQPLRDVAHARLLSRLRARLAPTLRFRTEVPLRGPGDLRAWDAEIAEALGTCKVEAETQLRDFQATDRRIALKMADDGVDRVILLVADTRYNRLVLREFGHLLDDRYPLRTRLVLQRLGAGVLPERSGVLVL